jgi:hypothetical protein
MKLTTHLHLVAISKNAWSYTSTPQYVFMAWCLVKHKDNFTLYLDSHSFVIFPSLFMQATNFLSSLFRLMNHNQIPSGKNYEPEEDDKKYFTTCVTPPEN